MKLVHWLLILSLASCTPPATEVSNNEALEEILIEYAEHFELNIIDDGYELVILDPNTGEKEERFIINPRIDRKIIGLTSTLNGMLNILSSSEQLVGVTSIDYVYDSSIIERHLLGEITEFGDETTFSVEKIISSNANTIFYSGFGDKFPHREKLEKFNFTILPIYDWREQHPLGKAEWIKVVGILVNKEQEAIDYFEEVKRKYLLELEYAAAFNSHPTVVSGSLYNDIWYAPGGDSYMAQIIEDAGANYIYADLPGTGSLALSLEQILVDNDETKFWINPGFTTKEKILQINPHVDLLKAYDNIYCYSPNINKFWENSAIEPHLVLRDLINIFHSETHSEEESEFYEKIE